MKKLPSRIAAKKRTKIARDDPAQSRAFIEKAREVGADESSAQASDNIIGRLATKPPEPRTSPKKERVVP